MQRGLERPRLFVLVSGGSASTRVFCSPAQSHLPTHRHHISRGGFYQSQKAAEDNGGFHCADCAKRQLSAMTIAMLAFAMTATIMLLFFFKKHKKQFLRWTHNNRIALNTLGDTITVLWVTMQVHLYVRVVYVCWYRRNHHHLSLVSSLSSLVLSADAGAGRSEPQRSWREEHAI